MFKIKSLLLIDRFPLGLLCIFISVAYVSMAMHLPLSIYTTAGCDDALFLSNAYQLIEGNWLGTYNQMTLVKGVGFPLFLAMNAVLGTPVTLLIALLYVFACGLMVNTLYRLGLNKYLLLIIYVVILFHPQLFPTRIIRDDIYPALTLIILSGVIRLIYIPVKKEQVLIKIAPYGLIFGLFWLTREEGIWVVPGVLLLVVIKIIQLKKQKLPINALLNRVAVFSLVATLPVILISSVNYHKYGKFETVDFKGKAFSRALKSLYSVNVGADLPYLPVSFNKRQEIYKVSPTFSQLKSYFEDEGKRWSEPGCEIYPWTCGDYAGGWFPWALRDAVASKGYYKSPELAADFYSAITNEIEAACDDNLLMCRSNPIPLMPNISVDQLKKIPEKFFQALNLALVQAPVSETGGSSWGPLLKLNNDRFFLGNPKTVPASSEEIIELRGWYYSGKNDWVVLTCMRQGEKINIKIDRRDSPDIAVYFNDPDAKFQRFTFSVTKSEDCNVSIDPSPLGSLQINSLLDKEKGLFSIGENGNINFDEILKSNIYTSNSVPLKIKSALVSLYKLAVPVMVLFGFLAYMIHLIYAMISKTRLDDVLIISTMLWCLFFSRIILLVLVDISSFPAINILYMLPAFPILLLAAFASMAAFTNTIMNLPSNSHVKRAALTNQKNSGENV